MKKLLISLLLIFLVTGCSCNYTLKIDDKISDELEVTVPNSLSSTKKEEIETSLRNLNPLIDSYEEEILFNYNKTTKGMNDIYKLKYTYDNYMDSTFSALCFQYFNMNETDEYYVINASGKFGCLYDNEKININIETDKYVSNNNADKVKDNKYTWVIDSNNKDNVNINATIMKNIVDTKPSTGLIIKNIFKFLMILGLICGAIILYLQMEKGK